MKQSNILQLSKRINQLFSNIEKGIKYIIYQPLKVKYLMNRFLHGIFFISYPKCGRTWVRTLMGKSLCDKYNLDERLILDTQKLFKISGLRPILFTHDNSSLLKGYKYFELSKQKYEYSPNKIIFLIRNIKDVLVSSYFQATKRVQQFEGNISEFIRDDRFGVKKVITFYNIWYQNMNIPRKFLLIRYRDLHKNPIRIVKKMLRFIGLEKIDSKTIKKAVEFSKFENMKKLEKKNYFNNGRMNPINKNDPNSYKVRKGKIEGYKSELNKDDIKYINEIIEKIGCPFQKLCEIE
jgi:hypothetical protein